MLSDSRPGKTPLVVDFIDAQGFRANVGIIVMRDDGRVFLGRRSGGHGWQFPQGGIARGEQPDEALYRELKEEIGLDRADVTPLAQSSRWLRYKLPARYVRRDQTPICIGQKQRWFLLKINNPEREFRFDHTATPEFDQWRWASYWEPLREVVAFKRDVYERALHELGLLAFPQGLPAYPDWWGEVAPSIIKQRQRA